MLFASIYQILELELGFAIVYEFMVLSREGWCRAVQRLFKHMNPSCAVEVDVVKQQVYASFTGSALESEKGQ